ncbi:MAG: HAMP domain-containing histidine kinase [Gemmatimonadetes bacterium]|nr:HAMP domain-containing histidine kinase [Gemmatimonadota bacterium]
MRKLGLKGVSVLRRRLASRVRLNLGLAASLRWRYVIGLFLFVVLLTLGGTWYAWDEADRSLRAELNRGAGRVAAAAIATGLQPSLVSLLRPGFEGQGAFVQERLKELEVHPAIQASAAFLLRPDPITLTETVVVSTLPLDEVPIGAPVAEFNLLYRQEIEEARVTGHAATPLSFEHPDGGFFQRSGGPYNWGFAALKNSDGSYSDIVLAVLMPADYEEPLDRLGRNLLLGCAIAVVLAAILANIVATGVARPLERLSRAAIRIHRGLMREPVAQERTLELGRLSRAMERMRQGILERDENLRLMPAQVAHEIRNPLGGLELFLAAAYDTEDPVERRRLLARAREETATLSRVVNEFLVYARPLDETGNEVVDVRIPMREASELVEAEMAETGGKLVENLSPNPQMARAASDHVKRIVLNLLRNASQVADEVRLSVHTERGEIVISVVDNGPGVPGHLRERIFDPFVTDKEQGAGLGLAIVRKLAEANGGRVTLLEATEGAHFRVFLRSLEDPSGAITYRHRDDMDG